MSKSRLSAKARYDAVEKSTHVYIGRIACGCMVAVVTDVPGDEKQTAKDVAEFIRNGYAVSRVTFAEYHAIPLGCKCEKSVPVPSISPSEPSLFGGKS